LRARGGYNPAMNHWLMKTEPDEFSIDDLARVKVEPWSGVRNYQARNHLKAASVGDLVLFYHSSCPVPGVAGVATVARAAYADPTQFDRKSDYYDPKSRREDPRWMNVDVKLTSKTRLMPLEEMRSYPQLAGMRTLRPGNRLSITPVTEAEWNFILARLAE
jgi:predicted RNA-binding protein with PUA-like domain